MRVLPFLLSMLMAIIISITSYIRGVGQGEIYVRMIISLVLFFMLGLFIRSNVEKLHESIKKEKQDNNLQDTCEAVGGKENA